MDPHLEPFDGIQVWIQVWNLPNRWISKETGFRFRHLFHSISDVIIPDNGSKQGRHLKILAELNLDQPLLRGTKLQYQNKEIWAEFRYENMAAFCFYCGLVGHSGKNCAVRKGDVLKNQVLEGQFGS